MCSCGHDAVPDGWTHLHETRPGVAGEYEIITVAGRNQVATYDGEQFVMGGISLPDCTVVAWRVVE